MSSRDSKMTTKVILSCHNGNALIGASEITCLPSGNWSAPLPVCESILFCSFQYFIRPITN